MPTSLDLLLSRLTMYRLMLYFLTCLVVLTIIFSFLKLLPFNPIDISLQTIFLLLTCYLANLLFSKLFKAPTNLESFAITALILSLIVGPISPPSNFYFLLSIAVFAMASKYLLVIHRRHIFNPAAFAVLLPALLGAIGVYPEPLRFGASWWVGTDTMAIPILIGGLLILKKLRRLSLVLAFFATYFLANLITTNSYQFPLNSPLLFFATVMLIEPLTSPVIFRHQIIYAVLIAVLFTLFSSSLFSVPYSLELSLVFGNLLAYTLAPTSRFILHLKLKRELTPGIWSFSFISDRSLKFIAGQYLELTLPHKHPDSRGVRRFFTISSSPTEPETMITSKFVESGSSFKKALLSAAPDTKIFANGPSGEFVLPRATSHVPIAFVAGGIGITPFRSMMKYLADTNQTRDVILLYTASSEKEFVFKDLLPKTVYKVGHLEEDDIKRGVPDYKDRLFYVSGPEPMVEATEKMLRGIGISRLRIKRDYFPGYGA